MGRSSDDIFEAAEAGPSGWKGDTPPSATSGLPDVHGRHQIFTSGDTFDLDTDEEEEILREQEVSLSILFTRFTKPPSRG
jgi:hypothetical protein